MTKADLEKSLAEVNKKIADRQQALITSDALWCNLQGQAAWIEKWLQSFDGEAQTNGSVKKPKSQPIEA